MPGGSGNYKDQGDESDGRDAIPTASQQRRPPTELVRIDLGSSDVDENEGDVGNDADLDEEEEESLVNDGSTQTLQD